MQIFIRCIAGLILLFSSFVWAQSNVFTFPQGEVKLVSLKDSLGLHFKIAEHWHIYWKNSGDSGAAPKWEWQIEGAKLGHVHWPVPERIPVESLINIGYSNETLFVFDLEERTSETIKAKLDLEFLICKIECIPYFATLSQEVTVDNTAEDTVTIDKTKYVYPESSTKSVQWTYQNRNGDELLTTLKLPSELKGIQNLEIFPEDGSIFRPQSAELEIVSEDEYAISIPLQDIQSENFNGAKFLLVTEKDGVKKAFEAELQPTRQSFALILLWALIGGLILNVMPCVFPVLSIKVLSFLGPDKNTQALKVSGWFYTAGVVVSFALLGGLLLFLRATGEQIGWGFQLQSPLVASAIALLFFWLSLNFLGIFEIGQSLSYVGATKTSGGHWGSFWTGVLATVVATPCTAPFMGAALGAALTLSAAYTMLIFIGLGLGMALPFLLLAYFPAALKFLPRPGLWMQRLKEFLAFPLLLTVLWLLWVLSLQIQSEGLLYLVGIFIFVGFWIWFAKTLKSERVSQWLLVLGFILSMAFLFWLPKLPSAVTSVQASDIWKPYTADAVAENIKNKEAVFIDFTAAWCITCQVNKKVVLNTDEIQQAFAQNSVQLYKADWTDRNPAITQALASYGRNSLPLYVYYRAGSDRAQLLPEVLTKGMILDLFTNPKEEK